MPPVSLMARQQPSTHQSFFILSWILFGIALLLLGGRCYTCWKLLHRAGADIYLAIFTFCIGAASMVILTIGATQGLGQHTSSLDPTQAQHAIMNGWLNIALALIAIGLGKMAVVAFILHIQGYYEPWRSAFLWFVAGSNFVINITTVVLIFTQCIPIQKLWNHSIHGSCAGRVLLEKFGIFQTSWSSFCDITLSLYPAVLFWNVQAFSLLRKIGISILFGLGVIAATCAAFKASRIPLLLNVLDATYALSEIIVWHQTEMWIVLIVGCIPPTVPFFKIMIQKIFLFCQHGSVHSTSELVNTAEDVGFFTLTDHGISTQEIEEMFSTAEAFFALPDGIKATVPWNANNTGWEKISQIHPSIGQPDTKESYQLQFGENMAKLWISDEHVPGFKAKSLAFMHHGQQVSEQLMRCFARGLGSEEAFFIKCHHIPRPEEQTTMRLLLYFALPEETDGKTYHRAGAHTDWAFLTLLFQKEGQSGLEICPSLEVVTEFGIGDGWTKVDARTGNIVCRRRSADALVGR